VTRNYDDDGDSVGGGGGETAPTELHRKVSVQKLKLATQYCTTVDLHKSAIVKQH
jgi:hypothetical protein